MNAYFTVGDVALLAVEGAHFDELAAPVGERLALLRMQTGHGEHKSGE
jgi:hypothetical protein